MMKRRAAFFLLIALSCTPRAIAQQSPVAEAEQAARGFLYALYANDAADVQRRILPGDDASPLIGRGTLTPAQLDRLREDINGLPMRVGTQSSPDGAKIVYLTHYRGVGFVLPLQRTSDGWKVDVRFWLAMRNQREVRPQKTDPEIVAKSFLCYLLAKEPQALNQFTSQPIKGEEYTAANNLPPGDLDHILSLCVEMPIVRARAGERVVLPSGEVVVGGEHADSVVLIGLMGPVEVPFLLKRVGEAWKVTPQKYFEMLRKAGAI
jgi:hypothetical protein